METVYSADFTQSDGGFTTDNPSVWKSNDATYGWKGTAFIGGHNLSLEALLTSGEIDLTGYKDATLSFDHVVSRAASPKDVLYVEVISDGKTDVLNDHVTWPAGTDWTPVSSGDISLSSYAGKKIQIQFHYTSTVVEACVWAIKDLKITGSRADSGISGVTTDARPDFSKPYQAYSVSGAAMSRDARNGIMIIRQGGKTWKLVK